MPQRIRGIQKKIFLALSFIASFILIFQFLGVCKIDAAEKKEIRLITVDLEAPYKVLDLVVYRVGEPDISAVNEGLKGKAQALGADYIIGVGYFSHSGYLYGYGTAVKVNVPQ